MFYSYDEFEFQVSELIAAGLSEAAALATVRQREREDEAEYRRWLDEQAEADAEWHESEPELHYSDDREYI